MSTVQRSYTSGFLWTGVAMTLACIAVILAGNTELVSRFEHTGFPLSWAFAGVAILAFLAAEICDVAFSRPTEDDQDLQYSPEWEVEPYC